MRGPYGPVAAVALLGALLGACSGTAQDSPGPVPSANATSTATTSRAGTVAATAAGPVRCAVDPNASPAAEIRTFTDSLPDFEGDATINAGEAVAFVSGGDGPHTVTEGSYGVVAADPCVDEALPNKSTVTVTFTEPGIYQIACRPHPVMQTTVTVE